MCCIPNFKRIFVDHGMEIEKKRTNIINKQSLIDSKCLCAKGGHVTYNKNKEFVSVNVTDMMTD